MRPKQQRLHVQWHLPRLLRLQYMVEIQTGVALLALLAMQGFHLTQMSFAYLLEISCSWMAGNHFHLTGLQLVLISGRLERPMALLESVYLLEVGKETARRGAVI